MQEVVTKNRSSYISPTDVVAVLGGSGFIGSRLVDFLLTSQAVQFKELWLASRDLSKNKFQKLMHPPQPGKICNILQCDHLNPTQLQKLVSGSTSILNLAGLAWQHPSGQPPPQKELLKHELLQNAVSAVLIAQLLQKEQRMVWTSTSAIDGMFARLNQLDTKKFRQETEDVCNHLISTISSGKTTSYPKIVSDLVDGFYFYAFSITPQSAEKTIFAFEFSYAYSKYVGQLILEKLSQKNIRVLKISDVYGYGQDISAAILNPLLPARRIQRYIAAYREISRGNIAWMPSDGSNRYGFGKDKKGAISQDIWSDWVFPTTVGDVCRMVLSSLDPKIEQTVLNVNGNRMSNRELMELLRDYFAAPVKISEGKPLGYTMTQDSSDLPLLGMSTKSLVPFEVGLQAWLRETTD